ncbi:MAG: hypothetical protein JNM42_11995 [Propionivibrio sp.]|uniref:hypothetical protein n=1 Tax=Propionivibrio sp. TaxID=2212460 RepID=UPI001A46A461|nr:hypothetical protein [Propionivibrio sp.]MBL8415150.1 hypothetical protein [Propionivibrio sp.]
MPIAREGHFLVSHDLAETPSLGLESVNLSACIQEAKLHPYKSVFGSPCFGFTETSLDALTELPRLDSVWFWDVALKNIEALYALSALRSFGVHPKRPAIDFSRLRSLQQVVWHYKATDTGLGSLNLKRLHIWHCSLKSKGFAGLQVPDTLEELQINWASAATLDGLPTIPSLRHLEIHRCRNLESLAVLPKLFPRLEHLVVAACGRVSAPDAEWLKASIPSLRHAYVRDRKVI